VLTFFRSPRFRKQRLAAQILTLAGALADWAVFGLTIVLWRFPADSENPGAYAAGVREPP